MVASAYIWGFCIDEIANCHPRVLCSFDYITQGLNKSHYAVFNSSIYSPANFLNWTWSFTSVFSGKQKTTIATFLGSPKVSLRNLFTDAWRRYIIKGWTAAPQQQQPTPSATQLRRAPSLWPKTYSTSNKKMLSCHHYTLSLAITLLFTLAVLICHASVTSAECACRKRSAVRFDDCKPGEISARDHRQPDVGLVGDCLPEVPDAKWVICANELSWISLHS